jgi:hypothetical protein
MCTSSILNHWLWWGERGSGEVSDAVCAVPAVDGWNGGMVEWIYIIWYHLAFTSSTSIVLCTVYLYSHIVLPGGE